jgi:predicted enzyme related to lactoylglutathione lyase
MMTKMADTPVPHWLFYFSVEAAGAGADRVKAGGGQVLMGPYEVPGGGWIVIALDPQGGPFALLADKP